MSKYDRIFGIGPVLLLVGTVLTLLTLGLRKWVSFSFNMNSNARYTLIYLLIILIVGGLIFAVKSLPVQDRGKKLITTGAFAFVRHPLYASLILLVPPIFTLLTQDLIFLLMGVLNLMISQYLLNFEEKIALEYFRDEYREYQRNVPRLIPYKGKYSK